MKRNAIRTIQRINSVNAALLLIFGLAGLWLCAVPVHADPISGHGPIPDMTLKINGSAKTQDVSSYFSISGDGVWWISSVSSNHTSVASFNTAPNYELPSDASGNNDYIVEVQASSGTGDRKKTATQTFTVTVTDVNEAPEAVGAIPAVTLNEDGNSSSVDVSGNFTDPDGDTLSYTASSSAASVATATVASSTVTITPVAAGSATVTVTASDGSLNTTQTIAVTVNPALNRSPVVETSITPVTLTDGQSSVSVNVSDNFSDPDNDELTYTAVSSDTSVVTVSMSGDSITITSAGEGEATITVTAMDSDGLTITETFTVTVNPAPNRSPVVETSITPVTLTDGQSSVSVNVSDNFSDPDNDELTYTAVSSDTSVVTVSVSGNVITITSAGVGTTAITVTATDSRGLTVTTEIGVTIVQSNTARYRTELLRNYPNPFNPDTWIPYRLGESANVTVTIYDVSGRIVRILKVGHQEAGDYTSQGKAAHWDGRNDLGEDVAAVAYFYNLTTSNYSATLLASVIK